MILLIVAYLSVMLPFNVAFKAHQNLKIFYIADFCLEIVFIVDILLNFRTTFINPKTGRLVTKPKLIAHNYLTHWFTLDLLAALPFDILYLCNKDWVSDPFFSLPALTYSCKEKVCLFSFLMPYTLPVARKAALLHKFVVLNSILGWYSCYFKVNKTASSLSNRKASESFYRIHWNVISVDDVFICSSFALVGLYLVCYWV